MKASAGPFCSISWSISHYHHQPTDIQLTSKSPFSASPIGLFLIVLLLQLHISMTIPLGFNNGDEGNSSTIGGRDGVRRIKTASGKTITGYSENSDDNSEPNLVYGNTKDDKTNKLELSNNWTDLSIDPAEEPNLLREDATLSGIVKRASGNNEFPKKFNTVMSFGQLLILAQEEAKCLLQLVSSDLFFSN
jgi:hypothetical protein